MQPSHEAAEWVAVERVTELEIGIEHGIGLVAAELLEAGRVDAAIHPGRQGPALEAVATEHGRIEARDLRPRFDDPRDGPGVDGICAKHGNRRKCLRAAGSGWRLPDAPKNRAFGDPRDDQPVLQRPDWAEIARPEGNGHGDRLAGALALGEGEGEAETAVAGLQMLHADGSQLGAAEGAREADQE